MWIASSRWLPVSNSSLAISAKAREASRHASSTFANSISVIAAREFAVLAPIEEINGHLEFSSPFGRRTFTKLDTSLTLSPKARRFAILPISNAQNGRFGARNAQNEQLVYWATSETPDIWPLPCGGFLPFILGLARLGHEAMNRKIFHALQTAILGWPNPLAVRQGSTYPPWSGVLNGGID